MRRAGGPTGANTFDLCGGSLGASVQNWTVGLVDLVVVVRTSLPTHTRIQSRTWLKGRSKSRRRIWIGEAGFLGWREAASDGKQDFQSR